MNPLAHIDWIGTVLFPLIAMSSGIPLIGWAKPVPVDMRYLREPRRDFALVAVAGPLSNLLLAVLAAMFFEAYLAVSPEPGLIARVLLMGVVMNVLLAARWRGDPGGGQHGHTRGDLARRRTLPGTRAALRRCADGCAGLPRADSAPV